MSTTDLPINQLHALWITSPNNYETRFFEELRLVIARIVSKVTEKQADFTEKKEADQNIVSDVLIHLLSTPKGKARSRLEGFEPRGSFFGWLSTIAENLIKTGERKKTVQLVQLKHETELEDETEPEDGTELEKQAAQFAKDNPPAPKLSADCIADEVTRGIAEAILAGRKIKDASEAVGLTANAGQLRLQKLRKRLTPEVLAEAYERGAEAKAILEWRPALKIAGFINENDPRLYEAWDKAA